ncbi:MAG: iron-containing alcohol dehydrogenase [Oliverpabstia sp.]
MSFTIFMPTKWIFGVGALNELRKQSLPGNKAMLVTSNGKSTKESGSLYRVIEQLARRGVESVLFDKVEANPLKTTVMEGAAFAKANRCDFLVALGGGSVMDASKAMAAMATNSGDLWDYISGGTGKGQPLTEPPLPVIAITTTAGTGSEVDQWGVVSNDEANEKIGFGGYDSLFPVLSIVDPELMTTVPPMFTAFQGFDALFHSTEVYISKFANPFSDMVALTAIENVAKNLAKAVNNGADMDAREKVAFANTLSGYSMVTGACTSEHAMEHAMSAYHHDLPHGAGLIMISKAYYQHFVDLHICDERFIKMAQVMGMPAASKAQDFITMLDKLQKDCGVDNLKMSDYGFSAEEFLTLVQNARTTMGGLFASDPVEMSDEDCVKIFEKSYR